MKKTNNKKKIGWFIFGGVVAALLLGAIIAVIIVNIQNTCQDDGIDESADDFNVLDRRVKKPIIYLYPENPTNVSVKLGNPSNLTVSYPQYNDGWDVFARPDGALTDNRTGRQLYSLYWEGKNGTYGVTDEGFIVTSEDAAIFLENKLAILGLNARESEEFIVYWLPEMKKNSYNYVRFATREEVDSYMPLQISPNPDNVIRVMMILKGLDTPIKIDEQVLDPTPARDGFTVVEWGGTIVK
jgi:hypothetical protein